jgi:hypothetical protein
LKRFQKVWKDTSVYAVFDADSEYDNLIT